MDKVSIITVSYNCEDTIEKTILSVLDQLYNNIEYIVIDGKSKDSTISIIHRYQNKIAKIISEPDKGIFDAMNKGINNATGEWIYFLNSGDTFCNNNILNNIFGRKITSDISVVYGDVFFCKNNISYVYKGIPFFKRNKKLTGMGISHQAIFVRTCYAKKYLFDLSYKYTADYDMIRKIYYEHFGFYYVGFPIANYDLTGVSSANAYSQLKEVAKICNVSRNFYNLEYVIACLSIFKRRVREMIKNKNV